MRGRSRGQLSLSNTVLEFRMAPGKPAQSIREQAPGLESGRPFRRPVLKPCGSVSLAFSILSANSGLATITFRTTTASSSRSSTFTCWGAFFSSKSLDVLPSVKCRRSAHILPLAHDSTHEPLQGLSEREKAVLPHRGREGVELGVERVRGRTRESLFRVRKSGVFCQQDLSRRGWYRKSVPNDEAWRIACTPLNRGPGRSSSTSSTASRRRRR